MSKPLDFFSYQKGMLVAQGKLLSEMAERWGTPLYVYSAEAFLDPVHQLQAGLKGTDSLLCFAVKSNSNVALLRLLARAGAGMDVVSGGELFRARAAGVEGRKIVFSGVGKTPEEIRLALAYPDGGIFSFNVESVAELELLQQIAAEVGTKARVALRFNPNVNAKTHPYISTGLKKNKFGLNEKEVRQIATRSADFPNLKLHGISIHIGSQLLSLDPLADAFAKLAHLVHELNSQLPEPIRFVDLGGGVGIRYHTEKAPSLSQYCRLIKKFFGPRAGFKTPLKLVIEPGRTISGNAGVLLTRVLFRKARKDKDFLIVDAGMNDLIRPALYGSYHEIIPLERKSLRNNLRPTMVVGPVCESADCFAENRALSSRLTGGDLLAVLSSGAYGFSMSSNYNSRPRPAEVLLENGVARLIRERETYEDLIRGEIL